MKTVLVVDDSVGFLFWLGKTLENAGYNVVPATSLYELEALLSHLELTPDLLVVNPSLSGLAEFIDILRREQPHLRAIAAIDEGAMPTQFSFMNFDGMGKKPPAIDVENPRFEPAPVDSSAANLSKSQAEWLLLVRTALAGKASSAD